MSAWNLIKQSTIVSGTFHWKTDAAESILIIEILVFRQIGKLVFVYDKSITLMQFRSIYPRIILTECTNICWAERCTSWIACHNIGQATKRRADEHNNIHIFGMFSLIASGCASVWKCYIDFYFLLFFLFYFKV